MFNYGYIKSYQLVFSSVHSMRINQNFFYLCSALSLDDSILRLATRFTFLSFDNFSFRLAVFLFLFFGFDTLSVH